MQLYVGSEWRETERLEEMTTGQYEGVVQMAGTVRHEDGSSRAMIQVTSQPPVEASGRQKRLYPRPIWNFEGEALDYLLDAYGVKTVEDLKGRTVTMVSLNELGSGLLNVGQGTVGLLPR